MTEITKRTGPYVHLTTVASCSGCRFDRSEYFFVEDGNDYDSGFNHYCDALGGKATGDGIPKDDCPYLDDARKSAVEAFLYASLKRSDD